MLDDWFEKITGFEELANDVHEKLTFSEDQIYSQANKRRLHVGPFETVSLNDLRERLSKKKQGKQSSVFEIVRGDAGSLHQSSQNNGTSFQVASQFNCLEMADPEFVPEDGVTIYQHDQTQGPSCAIAAGAGTIYRNYFHPVNGKKGQTEKNQIDTSKSLRAAIAKNLSVAEAALWTVKNGYLFAEEESLKEIDGHLNECSSEDLDTYRGLLEVGVHWDTQVTNEPVSRNQRVCQVFCSALPVSYNLYSGGLWEKFAVMILESAYEATLSAARLNCAQTKANKVFLTMLGGGAFGNKERWILSAIARAVRVNQRAGLDIKLVSYSQPSPMLEAFSPYDY